MKEFPNTSHIDPSSLDGLNHLGKFLEDSQLLSGAIPSNQDGSHDFPSSMCQWPRDPPFLPWSPARMDIWWEGFKSCLVVSLAIS